MIDFSNAPDDSPVEWQEDDFEDCRPQALGHAHMNESADPSKALGKAAIREALGAAQKIEPSEAGISPDPNSTIGTNGNGISEQPSFERLDLGILKENRRPAPAFPTEVFGLYWSKIIESIAEGAGAPKDYVAMSLLAGAAALIGNARRVAPWPEWEEPCILWCALVGNPSAGKTPAKTQILKRLMEIERARAAGFDEEFRRWETQKKAAESVSKRWEDECNTAEKNKVSLPIKPAEACPPPEPVPPRIVITDATIEVVGLILAMQPRGLLLHRDEISGWLGTMNKYGGTGDCAFWLEAFNGGPYGR